MAAKNDITGKDIKTPPSNHAYNVGWDRIYAKKTAYEWLEGENFTVLDPDGWRQGDGVTMDTPISWKDFNYRLNLSTIV